MTEERVHMVTEFSNRRTDIKALMGHLGFSPVYKEGNLFVFKWDEDPDIRVDLRGITTAKDLMRKVINSSTDLGLFVAKAEYAEDKKKEEVQQGNVSFKLKRSA